jgi:hypothetical protein
MLYWIKPELDPHPDSPYDRPSARRRLSNSASEAISVRDNLLFTTIFSGDFVLDDFLWDHTFFRVPHSGRGTSTKCAWKAASARTDASQSKNLLHDVP